MALIQGKYYRLIFGVILQMSKRVLGHYRFGKAFAWLNRHVRSRRKAIRQTRALYKSTGLVERGCCLCGNESFTLVAEGDRYGFDLNKQFCNYCGLIQTYPSLSKEFHQEFYSRLYRPLYVKREVVDYRPLVKEQSIKAEKYLDYFRNNGLRDVLPDLSVIEIGCSSGGTINTLSSAVKSVQGCDLDVKAIEFAKKNFHVDVEVASYPSWLPQGNKLFIMSHVLEHVYDPLQTLEKIRSQMSEGDYLFIAVPGINMVAEGDYKHDLRRYFHIAHVTDFTATTLTALAARAGLEKLAVDEEINGLFKPCSDISAVVKEDPDAVVDNLRRIEKTYHGLFPHL